MNIIEIGHRIKIVRKNQNITQEKLAELINVSPHYIYEIEKGLKKMSLETLISIAKVLNTSTDYILFGTDEIADCDISNKCDSLDSVIKSLKPRHREIIADILHTLIPHLK